MKKLLILIFLLFINIINVYATNYYGDVDGNNKIGVSDYILIRKHLLKTKTLTGDSFKRADVNKDNKISSADYVLLRKMIISGSSLVPIDTQYTIKYYGASIVDTKMVDFILLGSDDVPVIQSVDLKLSPNVSYVVSFDYKNNGGANKFNVDLYPDTLPETALNSTTVNNHYDWEVSSNVMDINNCKLRFFDNYQEANEKNIYISNVIMGTIRKDIKRKGETLGTLPTPTKAGYKFLGWYTSYSGGTKVSSSTVVSSNMVLYPHFEEDETYVLPEKFEVPKGYVTDVGKSYISNTLKYKTISNGDKHYSLVWVKNAYLQLNSANNNLKGGNRINILNQEISTMGYQSKGMIATNGSFTISDKSNTPIIVTKGIKTTNNSYNSHYVYTTLILGVDGMLNRITTANVNAARNFLIDTGARNTWAITHFEQGDWRGGRDGDSNYRTSLCQVDKHNFVLYTGYSLGIHDYMKELHDLFGCKTVVNLDGGGSTGMYYKTKSMTSVGTIYQRVVDNRTIADMLYFVE